MSLIARTKSSRIEAYTGVNPDELTEEVASKYRTLLTAKENVNMREEYRQIKLSAIIEKRRAELTRQGQDFTETSLKTFAIASSEYLEAVNAKSEAEAAKIEIEYQYKRLKGKLELLYKETEFAKVEAYLLQQQSKR